VKFVRLPILQKAIFDLLIEPSVEELGSQTSFLELPSELLTGLPIDSILYRTCLGAVSG